MGFIEKNGRIDKAYACGIKRENPNNGVMFCLSGALGENYGGSSSKIEEVYNANYALLNDPVTGLCQGTCEEAYHGDDGITCYGILPVTFWESGSVLTGNDEDHCEVDSNSGMFCSIW